MNLLETLKYIILELKIKSLNQAKILFFKETINMNVKIIEENYIGTNMTIVTKSGNKIQGELIKAAEYADFIKLKTENGIIMVSINAIESMY